MPSWNAGLTLAPKIDQSDFIRRHTLSILNKLTAENFEQQRKKILDVGLNSPAIINVVVQVIFQKAINEPKFTALYAHLCQQLSSTSPNFEPESSLHSTFCIFLLKLCEDEFKSRNFIDPSDAVARRKCLGNIRFIADLADGRLLPERITHECIRSLLSSRNRPPMGSSSTEPDPRSMTEVLALDMECLCLLLKIVGKTIDTPKARNLMDQYFQRIQSIRARAATHNEDTIGESNGGRVYTGLENHVISKSGPVVLPARIRFMIDDVLDLRRNGWIPRRAGQHDETDTPRYLRDIRMEIFKDSGTLVAPMPGERSALSRDVPGSARNNLPVVVTNTALVKQPTFINSNRPTPFCPKVGELTLTNMLDWQELARMGEDLCRSGPADMGIFNNYGGTWMKSSGPTFNRTDSGYFSHQNKRSPINSRSDSLSNWNNNNHATSHTQYDMNHRNENWTQRKDWNDDESGGWVRGVASPFSQQSTFTAKNGSSTFSHVNNLPPRMLRSMASDSNGLNGSMGTADNQPESHFHSVHLLATQTTLPLNDLHAHSVAWGSSTVVRHSGNHVQNGLTADAPTSLRNPAKPLEVFEPTFLHNRMQTPPLHGNENQIAYQQPNGSFPTHKMSGSLRPNASSHLPFQSGRMPHGASHGVVSSPLLHSDIRVTDSKPNITSHRSSCTDEQKRTAKRLLILLQQTKTPSDFLDTLQSPEFAGRLTIELLANFLFHVCEDGVSFPLAMLDSSELAAFLSSCAQLLDRNNSEQKHHQHPLAAVWSHLLFKLLQPSSISFSKSKFASLSANLLWDGDLMLANLIDPLMRGKHYPMFLLVLQQLKRMADECVAPRCGSDPNSVGARCHRGSHSEDRRTLLAAWFQDSGVPMNQMMPDSNQQNDKLYELLEERDLIFLTPTLQLSRQLNRIVFEFSQNSDSKANHELAYRFKECINTHLLPKDRQSPEFVLALMPAIYEYVYAMSCRISDQSSSNELVSTERAVFTCLLDCGPLEALSGSVERQLDALHALQLFWMSKNKPKGFLLRCFINLYNLDLVDENTFMAWREEIDSNYPAKGEALFEVNRWLTWLENAEEEDDNDQTEDISTASKSPDEPNTARLSQLSSDAIPNGDPHSTRRNANLYVSTDLNIGPHESNLLTMI